MPRRFLRAAIATTIAAFVVAIGCSDVTPPPAPPIPTTLSLTGPSSGAGVVENGLGACVLPLTITGTGGDAEATLNSATGTLTYTTLATQAVTTEQVTPALLQQWFTVAAVRPGESFTAQRSLSRDRAFKVKHEVSYTAAGTPRTLSHEFTCEWPPVSTVTLDVTAAQTLAPAATLQLVATPKDAAGAALSGRLLVWTSTDPAVASVSATGLVTGIKAGTTKISATSEDKKSAELTVTVRVPVASVVINPAFRAMNISERVNLVAEARDADGNVLAGRVFEWKVLASSGPTLGSVNGVSGGASRAEVVGTALGEGKFIAIVEGKADTATVRVEPAVASVVVTPATVSVSAGRTVQLTATPKSATGADLTPRPTLWENVNGAGFLTVDSTGLVTGLKATSLQFQVLATMEAKSGAAAIRVRVRTDSVVASDAQLFVPRGSTKEIFARLMDSTGTYFTQKREVEWSSSDTNIVKVASSLKNGSNAEHFANVAGVKQGTASILATADGKVTTIPVEVQLPVVSVTLTPDSVRMPMLSTRQIDVVLRDSVGPVTRATSWRSLAPAIADVSATGLVTPVSVGTTSIVATSETKADTTKIVVIPAVTSVVLTPPADSVQVGDVAAFTAVARVGSAIVTDRPIEITSSSAAIATVDTAGIVTGVAVGSISLIAKSETKADTSTVKVLARQPVAALVLAPTAGYVPNGEKLQLALTVKDAAGMALRGRAVSWTSSTPTVATVDDKGVVSSVGLGKTTITATSEGKTVTLDLDVVKPVAVITITPASDTLQPLQTTQLVATLKDAEGGTITGRPVTWSSSSNLTVSQTGLVTAQSLGQGFVTLAVDGKQQSANILVVAPVAIVEVGPENARVPLPGTLTLVPVPKDQDGNVLFARTFTWSSSNPAVATVSATGVVTAVALGTVTISATSEGKTGTRSVTVSRPVATVTVAPASQTIPADVPLKLTATMKDATGATLTGGTLTWTSSNSAVATVAADGTVTPLSAGTVTITASIEGKSGTSTLTVFMRVASVVISAASPRVKVEGTLELDAVTLDKNGATLLGRTVTWSSANTSVVTVDATGRLTGIAPGTSTITATSEGMSASVPVEVFYPVTGVMADPFDTRLVVGGTTQLKAIAFGPAGDTLQGRTVQWSSENPSIATVTSSGSVRAVAPGTARVIAFIEESWGNAFVVVDTPPLSQVIVSPATLTIPVGKAGVLSATLKNSVGGTITGKTVTWSSSDVNMAFVNAAGRVETSFKPGTVTITATAEGKSGTSTITIPPIGSVASITLSTASQTILVGQKPHLFAQLLDANGVDLQNKTPQPTVTWTQTDPTVLTVEGSMIATLTALKPGTTTLTATSEGKTAQITITVVAAGTVGSLTVTPGTTSLLVGQTKQLVSKLLDASGTLINGATYTFASSDATIATVSTNGTVTALKAGTATITVTSSGKTATASVIVGRPPIFLLEVLPENATALMNETRQFSARIIDNTATALTDRQVKWSSSDTRIATVSATGLATAKALGNGAICAESEGHTDCGFINVVSAMPQVGSVTLSHSIIEMWGFGYTQTQQLTATVRDGGGAFLFGLPVTWASSRPSVASVSSSGLVTSASSGATMITATVQGKSDTAWVLVDQRKISGMYIAGPMQMYVGEKATFTVRLNDIAGNLLSKDGRTFDWSSSNTSVVSIDDNGIATANGFGAAEIQVRSEGLLATYGITVASVSDPIVSVEISPKADTIWVDSIAIFTAGYTRASGKRSVADGSVRFTSSDPTVASIPEYGAVIGWYTDIVGPATGLKAGKATITASIGGKTATAEVVVVPPPPVATVTLSPNPAEIVVNTGEYVGYTLRDATGKPLGTRPVSWTIANSAIATVNQEGWIVGRAIGTTTVTATSEGKSGSATVTIVAAAPAVGSVSVSPNPASASVGGSVQLNATVRDATGVVLTGRSVTWTSSNTATATVTGGGLVVGKTAGTVTITATSGGKSGSATVNIGSSSGSGSGGSGGGSTSAGLCESWVSVAAPAANTETPWKALPFPNGMDWKIKHSRGFGVSTYTVHFRNRYTERIYFSATGPSKNKPTETRFALSAAANGGTTSNYEYPENPTTLWVYVAGVRFGTFSAKQFCGN